MRGRVAGLGLGCHRTHFDEAETHGTRPSMTRLFYQPCGHADAVGKRDASQCDWVVDALIAPHQASGVFWNRASALMVSSCATSGSRLNRTDLGRA